MSGSNRVGSDRERRPVKTVTKWLAAGAFALTPTMALPTVAGAHDGHTCEGRQSEGFSCASNWDPAANAHVIVGYYSGSIRAEVTARLDSGWRYLACDRRSEDTIHPALALDVVGANDSELRAPNGACTDLRMNHDVVAVRLVFRTDTGSVSHGTTWYPLPPAPPPVRDGDGDGVLPPVDCDDRNPGRHPGSTDVPGNGIDENCDGADALLPPGAPPARITAGVTTEWTVRGRVTRVRSLGVRDAPPGAMVRVSCRVRRCALRKRRSVTVGPTGRASLMRVFRHRRLRLGTLVEVRITAPNMVGKVVRYRTRRRDIPRDRVLCLPPGARKPTRCR